MKLYFKFLLCFVVLTSLLSTFTIAEEIETLSIPQDEDIAGRYLVKFKILDSNGENSRAILSITNNSTNTRQSINIIGSKELSLPEGNYTARVDAGLRNTVKAINFSLPSSSEEEQIITITPYAPVEPVGWIMLDTFFNRNMRLKEPSISELASSLELRAVFTSSTSIIRKPEEFYSQHKRSETLIATITPYLNPEYGELLSFNNFKDTSNSQVPVILNTELYPLLASLGDSNKLTALSSKVSYKHRGEVLNKSSEEFIFDTIVGPIYDLFLLDNFDSSVKVWHALLNQGYRIPGIYAGGSNFYQKSPYPSVKAYVKIARKSYNQKMLHKALKDGKSVISNGPFIRLFVESIGSKESIQETGLDNDEWLNGRSLKIGGLGFTSKSMRNIYAESYTCSDPEDKIKSIELIYNGKVIKTKVGGSNQKALTAKWKVQLDKPGWLQLRYTSTSGKFHAITNPIYLINHQSAIPNPALAKTQIQVLDAKSGKQIKAKILVENFGVITNTTEISEHAIVLQTPATASIIVEASGYKTSKKSVYIDGGGAKYIRSLADKKVLNRAILSPIAYDYLRKALANSKLIFKLHKK